MWEFLKAMRTWHPGNFPYKPFMALESLFFATQPKPVINKPPPLNRDYNRDPNIKALKRRGFINHGSTPYCLRVALPVEFVMISSGSLSYSLNSLKVVIYMEYYGKKHREYYSVYSGGY